MTATVFVASALMGAGKTRGFIERIKSEDNIILAVPTINLGDDIVKDMKLAGVNYEVFNSEDNVMESTKSRIEQALIEGREGCVLVITQKALTMLKTDYLAGWKIVCDEVPNLSNCQISDPVPFSIYNRLFNGLVQDHDDGKVTMRDGVIDAMLLEELKKSTIAGIESARIMFGGLLEKKAEVKLLKMNKEYVITVSDYHDYINIIKSCLSFHVMGNSVEKSLFYHFVIAKGCVIKKSEYTPSPFKYKASVTLVPMFNTESISREKMELKEDGSKSLKFDETCLGWKAIKNALEYHQGERVLIQCFSWMKKFPFADYINATVTPFDSRGLNVYRNTHHRTVNIIHGNPIPILKPLHTKMLEMMGVEVKIGRAAIEHEMFIEPMAQHIARTSIRNGIEGDNIFVVLPTIDVATRIEEVLQIDCKIDLSIMLDIPEKAPTQSKMKKAERNQEIRELRSKNYTHKEISKLLGGCSTKTVQRVLNSTLDLSANKMPDTSSI